MTSDFLDKKTEQNLPLYNKRKPVQKYSFLSFSRSFLSLQLGHSRYRYTQSCFSMVSPRGALSRRVPGLHSSLGFLFLIYAISLPITNHSASSRSIHRVPVIIFSIVIIIIIITARPLTWPYWWRSQRAPPWRPRLRCRTGPSRPSSSCGSIYSAPHPRSHCCSRPRPARSSWVRPNPGRWRTGWHCWTRRCCRTTNSKRRTWASVAKFASGSAHRRQCCPCPAGRNWWGEGKIAISKVNPVWWMEQGGSNGRRCRNKCRYWESNKQNSINYGRIQDLGNSYVKI